MSPIQSQPPAPQEGFNYQEVITSVDSFVKDLLALFRIAISTKLAKIILEIFDKSDYSSDPIANANSIIHIMENLLRFDPEAIELMNGGITPAMIARIDDLFDRLMQENGDAYDMGLEQVGLEMGQFDQVHHILKLIRSRDDYHARIKQVEGTSSES